MKNNLVNMMSLDIYLSSISENNFEKIYSKIEHNILRLPLMSWDIYSKANSKKLIEFKRSQDIIKVKSLASKFNWQDNIDSIFENKLLFKVMILLLCSEFCNTFFKSKIIFK